MTQLPACILRVEFDGLTWGDLRRTVALAGHYHPDDEVVFYWESDNSLGPDGIQMVPTEPKHPITITMTREGKP